MSSFPVLRTQLSVCFLSPLPDSLPQLFLRCLPYASLSVLRFRSFAFGLSPSDRFSYQSPLFRFWLLSLLFLPFLFLPVSPSQWVFFGAALSAFASLAFPRSFRPGFPCLLSRFFVLGFLFVSFHPSRFRSHSRSTGASLMLSLSGFSLAFRFLSSASARF